MGVDTDRAGSPALSRVQPMKLIAAGVDELIVAAREHTFPSGNHFGGVGLAGFHDHANAGSPELPQELLAVKVAFDEGTLATAYGQ